MRALRLALCPLLAALCTNGASAQDVASKTITITVGTPPASPASLYAQTVARHIGRYLDGNPTGIVQHLPGAGGLTAANAAFATMSRDGSALVSTNSALFIEPVLGGKGAQFDPRQFTFVGGTHVEHMTCITWSTSPVKTLQDAKARAANIASYGANGPSAIYARAANNLAGTRFTVIAGYGGGPEALAAMERGEVDGFCAMGWQELSVRHAGWLKGEKVNVLFQMGLEPEAAIPTIPLLLEHARTPTDRQAMELLFTPLQIGRPIYAPPGVPVERVRQLRLALKGVLQDDRLLADAEKAGLPIRHTSGEAIERLIEGVYGAPSEVIERARAVYE